jgi:hypothetical protein
MDGEELGKDRNNDIRGWGVELGEICDGHGLMAIEK